MNRETIASLEQQARALDATAVHVLVEGNTLLDVGDTARPIRVQSIRKSLISALYGVAYDQGVVDLGATLGEVASTTHPLSPTRRSPRPSRTCSPLAPASTFRPPKPALRSSRPAARTHRAPTG